MLFDSHCHLHFSQFDGDREEVISRLKEAEIKVINVGTDLEDSKKAIKLAKKYPDFMWASIGLHPNCISTTNRRSSGSGRNRFEEDLRINQLKELAKNEKIVAIGECGLDYYRNLGNQKSKIKNQNLQKEIFIKHLELARELSLPVIIHARAKQNNDAYLDVLKILKSYNLTGVAHFFSGTKEIAKKFIDLGFYIGFAGPITFTSEYKELVEFVPMDRILIETDAPFAAPVPYRGQRNEPAFVEFVARRIAEWKKLPARRNLGEGGSFEEVARQTAENAEKLFRIK